MVKRETGEVGIVLLGEAHGLVFFMDQDDEVRVPGIHSDRHVSKVVPLLFQPRLDTATESGIEAGDAKW